MGQGQRQGSGEWEPTRRMPRTPHETEETVRTRRLHPAVDEETRTEPIPGVAARGPAPVVAPTPSMRGRATVPSQRAQSAGHVEYATLTDVPHRGAKVPWFGPEGRLGGSRRGLELSIAAGLFAFVGWGLWAFDNQAGSFATHLILFVLVLLVATGVFCVARLVGYYLYVRLFKKKRGSARLSHLVTAVFLVMAGVGYFKEVRVISEGIDWIQSLL